jgi:integrase
MGTGWNGTKWPGVRFREHPSRKYGIKKDQYFAIRYQKDGTRKEEGLGWASEGWTAQKAYVELAKLKEAHTKGEGEFSLAEKRQKERGRKEAEAEEARIRELDAVTFGEFFKDTYTKQAQANKKAKTCKGEEQLFRLWIEPVIGNKPFTRISPLDLERIKKHLADAGRSPRTAHYCLAVIRQVFNLAKALGILQGNNPVSSVKKPQIDNRRLRFLTREEADRLLAELAKRSQQLHDIALLSLHCGLRAGEIFNLTWECIDISRGQILLKDTKSGKNRIAYMTNEVKRMLQERSMDMISGLIFRDRKGKKIGEVSNAFSKVVDALGLNDGISDPRQKVVFHTCRHTYASWLVEAGTDLYVVKKLMGHSSITMTERYSHLSQGMLQQAVKALEMSLIDKPINAIRLS